MSVGNFLLNKKNKISEKYEKRSNILQTMNKTLMKNYLDDNDKYSNFTKKIG